MHAIFGNESGNHSTPPANGDRVAGEYFVHARSNVRKPINL